MYRLLVATDVPEINKLLQEEINWAQNGFNPPVIVSDADEAIARLSVTAFDAVGYRFAHENPARLEAYLEEKAPTLPIFSVRSTAERQLLILKDLKHLLNRLNADFSDEVYDDSALVGLVQDEMTHSLLAGEITKKSVMVNWLHMLRAHMDPERTCILFEIDMPQGEVYLADRWHHGQERLENALRSNFFGRYADDIYYAVAVLTNRHIRLAAVPALTLKSTDQSFYDTAVAHVNNSLQLIKEYLDLDLQILDTKVLPSMTALVAKHN